MDPDRPPDDEPTDPAIPEVRCPSCGGKSTVPKCFLCKGERLVTRAQFSHWYQQRTGRPH